MTKRSKCDICERMAAYNASLCAWCQDHLKWLYKYQKQPNLKQYMEVLEINIGNEGLTRISFDIKEFDEFVKWVSGWFDEWNSIMYREDNKIIFSDKYGEEPETKIEGRLEG